MPGETLERQLERILVDLGAGNDLDVQVDRPRNPEHGDLATNVAMTVAGALQRPPRAIAEDIVDRLDLDAAGMRSAEVAGPGFINFRFAHDLILEQLAEIVRRDADYGRLTAEAARRIQVEFVSANPTGPLHVAHGRGAALGDAIASLLEWTGHDVAREFYVNDAGVQIDKLAASVDARWLQLRGEHAPVPEGGYHGEYVLDLARDADERHGDRLGGLDPDERVAWFRDWAVDRMRREQDETLRAFRVHFDEYYPESRLYAEERIEETLDELRERGLVYEHEGAVWLRTSDHGDDKDRVLVKSDGTYTYFTPDIAYHRDKAARGFEHVIDVWGADHHGYVPRMRAALEALGLHAFLDVEIVQMVRIMRSGREVRLSKRAGEFVTLRDLIDETGVDVARYFFLMRRGDAQMVFDLDLALDHSEKNPVYKIQYAHARMMSIFARAGIAAADRSADGAELEALTAEAERELVKQLAEFPEIVRRAAAQRSPHTLCEYLETTAGMVNSWYHAGNPSRNPELAVLVDDERVRTARLVLARAVRIVLRNGLTILGLNAPERMEREESS